MAVPKATSEPLVKVQAADPPTVEAERKGQAPAMAEPAVEPQPVQARSTAESKKPAVRVVPPRPQQVSRMSTEQVIGFRGRG